MKNLKAMVRIILLVCMVSANVSIVFCQDNTVVVKTIFAAFNKHDWEGMLSFYDTDAVFVDPAFTDPVSDQSIILAHHRDIAKYFPDIKDEIKRIFTCGDTVVVEFVASGKALDGTSFNLPICTVFTFRKGKVIRDATYYDLDH
jgi:ketosteroid isomerase-like protein